MRAALERHWPSLTVVGLTVLAFAGHVAWYRAGPPGGEVVSGFGAALVAIGVLVVGLGFLLPGALDRATAGAMAPSGKSYTTKSDPGASARRDELRRDTRRGIVFERIGVGSVVLIGTLLNGYGPVIARLLGLRC